MLRRARASRDLTDAEKEAIRHRDGDTCRAVAAFPHECSRYLHVHHVKPRSAGGGHDPANLLTVCFVAHQWIHEHPLQARKLGLLRGRYDASEGGNPFRAHGLGGT